MLAVFDDKVNQQNQTVKIEEKSVVCQESTTSVCTRLGLGSSIPGSPTKEDNSAFHYEEATASEDGITQRDT